MSKINWSKIELDLLYSCIIDLKFRVDGHVISIHRGIEKSGKFTYAVYIDGHIKGKWDKDNFPIIKKVWRRVDRYVFSKRTRDEMVKLLGKKRAKERGFFDRSVYYTPIFSNAKSLIRTLKKIDNIELLEV